MKNQAIKQVKKRNSEIVKFDSKKIQAAIEKAMKSVGEHDSNVSRILAQDIIQNLSQNISSFFGGIPDVEQIQDAVEEALSKSRFERTAKAYMLYRRSRHHARELRRFFGIKDDLKFDVNAIRVLQERYLLKDKEGKIIETPTELFERVAQAIASVEKSNRKYWEGSFFDMMRNLEFLPNSPTLMNAGTKLNLSACFTGKQPIVTSNGIKPIKDIKIGDSVLTASGKFAYVTKTMQRNSKERYVINVSNMPNQTLSVTKEHPILSLRENKPVWILAEDLNEGDYVATAYPEEIVDIENLEVIDFLSDERFFVEENLVYKRNKDGRLRRGHVSKQIKPVKNKIIVDSNLLRLFGYYASEGDIDGEDCVRFTFSSRETLYAEDILRIVKEKFGLDSKIENSSSGNWINVRFHSYILCQFFKKIIGKGFNVKSVPTWMLKLPQEKQKGFVIGIFRGDSTLFLNKHAHNAKLVMCNPHLVFATWVMLMRMKLSSRLFSEKMPTLGKTIPFGCVIKSSDSEDLMREIYSTNIICPTQMTMQRKKEIIVDDKVFFPIRSKQRIDEDAVVYNFEVEGEHTYVANGIAVHNCFVLPVEDNLESIFDSLKYMAMIQQSGGGTGFSFSKLRQKGEIVGSTKGVASGPVSFIKIYDITTDVIKQGGKRRGANMGILSVSHPDILEFVISKQKQKELANFNISVSVDDKFMDAVVKNENYHLISPKTNKSLVRINAKSLFRLICRSAWQAGDPGMIFIDEINRKEQVPGLGKIEATNPCAEQPMHPYESCNLGSINLTKILDGKKIDWDKLKKLVRLSVRFLDNVIDANKYPFPELTQMAKANRRIGLGIMGFAEMLILLEIPYDSRESVKISEKLMSFINKEAHSASEAIGKEKGNFPNFQKSIWKNKVKHMRNCACTTIAPTGTISIIAGCSSGIEPLFALAFMREVLSGKHLFETNKIFQANLIKNNLYSESLINKIAIDGNLKNTNLPKKMKSLFKTALEISAEQHIKIQAAFQKSTDNAVSKTINLPNNSSPEEIEKAYLLAHKLKCKGITIYRYGSKPEQVLYLGEGGRPAKASSEFAGGTCIGSVCSL